MRWNISLQVCLIASSLALAFEGAKTKAEDLLKLGFEEQSAGHYDRAEAAYRQALELADSPLAGDEAAHGWARILTSLASAVYESGRAREAEPVAAQAVALLESSQSARDRAIALNNYGAILRAQAKDMEAAGVYARAIAVVERFEGKQRILLAGPLANLGALESSCGRHERALEHLRQSVALREAVLPPGHIDLAHSYAALARGLQAANDFAAAEPYYRKSLAIFEKSLAKDHPQLARTRANFALYLRLSGRAVEAEIVYRQALDTMERTVGDRHPDYAAIVNNLGRLHAARRDWKSAQALLEKAVSTWESTLGPEHPSVASGLVNLAEVHVERKRFDLAERLLRRALRIDQLYGGANQTRANHARVAGDLDALGALELRRKRPQTAIPWFERALEIWQGQPAAAGVEINRTLSSLAEAHRLAGNHAVATHYFAQAITGMEQTHGRLNPILLPTLDRYEQSLRAIEDFAEATRVASRVASIEAAQAYAKKSFVAR